jgi:hypothetical protein
MIYDPDLEVGSLLERVLTDVGSERKRQLELKARGRFRYTLSDSGMSDSERLACLTEELGEVARASLVRADMATDSIDASDQALRKELCQIAALAVAWMERLGR